MSDAVRTLPREDVPPTDSGRRRQWPRLALLLPGVVMLVLGLWGLGRDGAMSNDEVATRWVAGLPLHRMAHVLHHVDAVHGAYYAMIHFWMVLGRSPTVIRVPSVIAMVLAVVAVGVLGAAVIGSTRAGVASGLIAALTPSISYYGQTARSYALVYLAVALATLLLTRALGSSRPRLWLLYGLLVAIAGYLNELSLLLLGAHLVTVLAARRGRAVVARWAAVSVVAVLVVSPLIVLSRRQTRVLDYLRAPDLDDIRLLLHTLFGGSTAIAVAIGVLALVGAAWRPAPSVDRSGSSTNGTSPLTVALPLLVVPSGLLLAYSEVVTPLYADRYLLFCEIGVAVLAGAGLERVVRLLPWPGRAAGPSATAVASVLVVIACAALFAGQLSSQHRARKPQSRQFDYGGPSAFVGAHARPGDGVLFLNDFYRKARLGYPADFRDTTDFAQAVSPARAANFHGRNKPFREIRPLLLDRQRVWLVGFPPGRVTSAMPSIRLQLRVLQRHFVRVAGRNFGRIDVSLWRRG